MSRQLDGVNTLKREEFAFNWSDGVAAVAFCNESGKPMIFARAEVVNGTTAGSATAGVFTLHLPNSDYVITCPVALAALMPTSMDAAGYEVVMPGEYVTGDATTAAASAKEAKLVFYYWGE